jgi:ubiquinone biosynthesis protein
MDATRGLAEEERMLGLPSADTRRRYRQVASVLTRHGMGALAARIGLERISPARVFGRARGEAPFSTAEHVRLALEELGTTAIKLGQILSARPDLVPADYMAELEKLRDRVPPVPSAAIVEIIEGALGRGIGEVFAEFDAEPLAAASIGQVHAARLLDGTPVAVKVRKPGVVEAVTTDLAILADLARRAARAEVFGPTYDVEALVDEFSWTLRAEMDYVREGRNADRLREIHAGDERIVIPKIYWDYTTSAVLVMERIDGIRIGDMADLDAAGIGRRPLARICAEALMKQVFEAGFFHADPHPGNFIVLADGRVALLDFGMVGQLDEELRHTFLQMFIATVEQDSAAITDEMEHLGILRSPGARDAVRRDVHHVLERYYGLSIDQFSLTGYIEDVLAVVRRQRLQLPAEMALVLKTVAMSEGLWRQLDPAFNAAGIAEPFVRKAASEMYAPKAWGMRMVHAAGDTVELGAYLPGQIRRIATRLDRGEFEVTLRHRDLDEALNRLSGMVTRLSMAIVTAAFIVGLPLLATVYEPPGWRWMAPAWFFGGIMVAAGLIARLAVAGRRQRH